MLGCLVLAFAAAPASDAAAARATQPDQQLKHLSLEQLGEVVVTSVSKAPEEVWQTPAAIFVITHDDIIRSGATSIADVLRLAPGLDVARIDSSRNWVVGIRPMACAAMAMMRGRSNAGSATSSSYGVVDSDSLTETHHPGVRRPRSRPRVRTTGTRQSRRSLRPCRSPRPGRHRTGRGARTRAPWLSAPRRSG